MRKLVKVPSEILKRKCAPVETITPWVKELAQEMVDYMDAHRADSPAPVGLSAPQLGVSVRVIAFAPTFRCPKEDIQVLINPVVVYAKGATVSFEGCLSIPGKSYVLPRAKVVKVRGLTLDGKMRAFKGRDLLARIFQHELDHLNGVLIDSAGKLDVGGR